MIRAGFFNAIKDADGNFDRVYNNEDFTSFLRGIINQNGVFYHIWDCCRLYANNNMNISVSRGKGIVYGHWFEVSSVEPVEIATPDPVFDRIDAITVYLDLDDRSIRIMDLAGEPSPNPQKPFVYGYDENTHEFEPNMGVVQLTLGYIRVRANTTEITDDDIIEHCVGTYACPWISQLAYNPDDDNMKNVDAFLAEFQDKFVKWFAEVEDTLQINMHLREYHQNFLIGDHETVRVPIMDYHYTPNDVFMVYKNGIKLQAFEFNIRYYGEDEIGSVLEMVLFPNVPITPGPPPQDVELVILQGTAMDYPTLQDVE